MKIAAGRERKVSPEEFKLLLWSKRIRPASLDDVRGTHHRRALYVHPSTGQWYVAVKAVK